MRTSDINITFAIPAKKWDIVKWLLTGGKFGKVIVPNTVKMQKYHATPDPRTSVNCRCVISPIIKDAK